MNDGHIAPPVLPVKQGDFIDLLEPTQLQGSILTNPIPRACPSHALIEQNSKISCSILM